MNRAFWSGRKVFLTGHTGFKGSWLSLWLADMGAEVTGFSLEPPSAPNLFELAGVADRVRSVRGDVRDRDALARAVEEARPEIVFHLAAQAIVRKSYDDPVDTYLTNVMGTVHLFEAVRRSGRVRTVVNITSDKCYENPEWAWGCREIDPMGGHDPYSNSKGCAELVTSAYRRSFFARPAPSGRGIALASVRAGNVIGGGDWARDRLIPDMVRAIEADRSTVIRNPNAVRPWQHVLEPLSGYLLLAERLDIAGTGLDAGWNFGPVDDDTLPVRAVLDHFCETMGGSARWHVERDENAPHEAHLLRLDITKARTQLGWKPRWRIADAAKQTANWYRAYFEKADMRRFTLEQIRAYEAVAA